jgi:hypothetical protein
MRNLCWAGGWGNTDFNRYPLPLDYAEIAFLQAVPSRIGRIFQMLECTPEKPL